MEIYQLDGKYKIHLIHSLPRLERATCSPCKHASHPDNYREHHNMKLLRNFKQIVRFINFFIDALTNFNLAKQRSIILFEMHYNP